MSRAKLFIENFLVYGLVGVISKAIPLVMLPIITRLVPDTSVYGIFDLLRVLVSFGKLLFVRVRFLWFYLVVLYQDFL